MTIVLSRPVPGMVTSGYGPRTPGKVGSTYHLGIDFSWNKGWTIFAAAPGRVIFAGYVSGYGNLIRIDHGGGWESRYAHQARFLVGYNAQVARGQDIGIIGNTGTSAGAHLHFELLYNGKQVNPAGYFTATAGGGGTIITNEEDTDMKLAFDTNGTGWLVTDEGWAGLPSMQVYNLFARLIKSTPAAPDTFNRAEVDIMNGQIRMLALANNTQATIDPIKLASAISDALPEELSVVATLPPEIHEILDRMNDVEWESFVAETSIDPEQLATAFNVAAPRVARALLKQQGALLGSIPEE